MSGQRRTNEYTAEPVSDRYRQCLFDWLAAHAPLWNQLTYRRRQEYFTDGGDVWEADFADLYDDYAPILGKAACQQVAVLPGDLLEIGRASCRERVFRAV